MYVIITRIHKLSHIPAPLTPTTVKENFGTQKARASSNVTRHESDSFLRLIQQRHIA